MRLFLDANVLVSVLNKEYPLFSYSAKILSLGDRKNIELLTSPVCLAITFYFASKKSGEALAKQKIAILMKHVQITQVDEKCALQAVQNPKVLDLEDGIQYYSALKHECDFIITENIGDFHFSEIPTRNCEGFLKFENWKSK